MEVAALRQLIVFEIDYSILQFEPDVQRRKTLNGKDFQNS
jgi:hypothetical protein